MRPGDGEALGGGSSGDVYAYGDVALKVFPGSLDERSRLLLNHELERLSALGGQVLVPGSIEDLPDGRCATRSELCTGSLPRLVGAAGRLSVSDTLVLGSALASTLATAHESGIVHGRLTPDNVLFRASGEPVVNDFEHTPRSVFVRDPDHGGHLLAPEQAESEAADLYGLGVVLYLALTGVLPHPGRPPLHREDAPIDLLALIENLLAEAPESRPADAALVADLLAGLATEYDMREQSTVDAIRPVTGTAETRVPPRRSVWPVLTVAAAAVLTTAAWILLPGSTDPSPPALAQPATFPTSVKAISEPGTRVELAPPSDSGSTVKLSWRAPEGMDSAIVVTDETGRSRTTIMRRQRSATIPVEPGRKYCFLVQVTDGGGIDESPAHPIRGADCR
ncbi:serine/threonine protein kinase [Amycolatopsis japonica]|uniref:serine/threonine protein kinase n=1 Tax=Amycolatopsis japonica TaxID=208439 RepID=UPI00366D58E9